MRHFSRLLILLSALVIPYAASAQTGATFSYEPKKGNVHFESAKRGEDGYYSTQIDFYNSTFDLKYSFGRAEIKYSLNNGQSDYVGFYDRYDFDPQQNSRSILAELITRGYGTLFKGTPFDIYFGKNVFKK